MLPFSPNQFLAQMHASLTPYDWLTLTEMLCNFAGKLKVEKQVFSNINPWSIVRNGEGEYQLIDGEFLASEGTYSQLSYDQ